MTTWLVTHQALCLCRAFIDTGLATADFHPRSYNNNPGPAQTRPEWCYHRALALKNGSNSPSEWSFLAVVRDLPSSRLMLWLGFAGPLGIAHCYRVNKSLGRLEGVLPSMAPDGPLDKTENWCAETSPKALHCILLCGDNQRRMPAKPKESAEAASANAIFDHNI